MFYPDWSADNPYLNLLMLEVRARGYRVTGLGTADDMVGRTGELQAGDVFHLHWTGPILQRSDSEHAARAAFQDFGAVLGRFARRGVRLVWTIHNQLPHELVHRDLEIDLYRLLAEHADLIHVMAPQTPEVLASITQLAPERVRVIPHPSFAGVYGGPLPADSARERLGLRPEDRTILFLGQMRPYKGLNTLLDAVAAIAARGGDTVPTLLLAGAADEQVRAEIDARMPRGVRVISEFGWIADADVPLWFGAADVAVFPYRAILNSGSLHLAAAFRVPAIVPGEPHLREMYGAEPWVRFMDLDDPVGSLAAAIVETIETPRPPREVFDRFNDARTPWSVAAAYADAIDELVSSA